MKQNTEKIPFTAYQKLVIFILAVTQFSVILDFMIMSPMGDMLMKDLALRPSQFGYAVSAYALSAGVSGLLTAGFADSFDRKKLLLFFYTGFIVGTFLCSLSGSYVMLLVARIVTGLFGGVIASVTMAIITDLFDIHHRGRVMSFVQMGLGGSQVLGIPISLALANMWGWRIPFLMVAVMAVVIAVLIFIKLRPVTHHLARQTDRSAVSHLIHTFTNKHYRIGFITTAFLSIGGYMMMPFGTAFAVNNLDISQVQLPWLFGISGVATLTALPLIGRLSDKVDKYKLFAAAAVWMMLVVLFYTRLSVSPLWVAITFNVLMMLGILGRMVPAGALTTGLPDMADRGAFMSINSSLQQIAGGVAAASAGLIVVQKSKTSPLENYDLLGYVMIVITLITMVLMYMVSEAVKRRLGEKTV
jgi:predicted MFS family arabinose efflux permease